MLIRDKNGNELLDVLALEETGAGERYTPMTHALVVVKAGERYLLGWNRWRKDWEIFGGCREEGETLRQCAQRECREELGLDDLDLTFLGVMHLRMAPGYFDPEWHEEYGGLYGVTLEEDALPEIEACRQDREEIVRLAFYGETAGEPVAEIDEKLLEYWP